ncbi:MAG: hypothetical protein QNJ68_11900 [Microcoleaceae cyanobacterium MO_207.B10]|nr:hypothetical protein [Microcoleaceae cyanobacterium MO_207.B10]
MFATNIINLGFWVWGLGCGEIIEKKKRKKLVIKRIKWKKLILVNS